MKFVVSNPTEQKKFVIFVKFVVKKREPLLPSVIKKSNTKTTLSQRGPQIREIRKIRGQKPKNNQVSKQNQCSNNAITAENSEK